MHSDSTNPPENAESHTLPEAPQGYEVRANLVFTVVGLGASAGGVAALSQFFRAVPSNPGMAFVVIQHLSPDNQSLMPDILQRCTAMPVAQIEDGMRIEPNAVYVIRPGFTVTLSDGVLRLGEPVEKRGHRRPVDDFFRSLALEQKERAIIVLLSGTGTNGTAGAQAVKAAGGLCVAQDPETSEFPGMPRSLIHAGYADQILPADQIPRFLINFVHHPLIKNPQEQAETADGLQTESRALAEVHAILRTRTGHDFRGYRKPTLLRRMQRRMGLAGVTELAEYARILRDQADEAPALANDLMINVTGFFRDPEAWEALREGAVRPLIERHPISEPIRAWVGACASGEEAYSLAMLIAEEIHRSQKSFDVKIFATDTADKSLALARAGIYPGGVEGDISQERLERFFEKDEHTYRIRKEIRDMVVFAPQNVLRDPPFSRVDLCTCRNLLIYLEPETQQRVLALLSFSVRDGGYLFLGNTENLGVAEQNFETVSKRWRIYRRVGPLQHRLADMPTVPSLLMDQRASSGKGRALSSDFPPREDRVTLSYERALLEELCAPTVIVDRQERLLYVSGDISTFIAYPIGEATLSLIDISRPSIRAAVRAALRQTEETHGSVTVEVPLESDGDTTRVRITAAPLMAKAAGRLLRVSFDLQPESRSVANGQPTAAAIAPTRLLPANSELEDELRILRRELQASVEAFEANNEELKSSNEEVLSVNEELQSTNEELETSKEELQSLNEELTTVNAQLQAKILELEQSSNDLSNLLGSTSIAVVFLDTQLLVRRFTPAVLDLLELIPTDIGRPVSDLAPKFQPLDGTAHEALRKAARAVLDNLTPLESEVRSDSGRWYLQRTLPYRTADNHIEGVVLTFVDISARKLAEQSLAEVQLRLQTTLEHTPAALIMVEAGSARILHANRKAAELFGQSYPPPFLNSEWASAVGSFKGWYSDGRSLAPDAWPLARSLRSGEVISDEQIEFAGVDGKRRTLSVSSAPVKDAAGVTRAAVAAFWDITNLKQVEKALRDSERRLRVLVESAQDFAIIALDTSGRVTAWNPGAVRMFGWAEAEILGQSATVIFSRADQDAGVPEREMRTALQTGRANDDRWHVRNDGTALWVNGVLSVARDESGTVQGFVKIMRDNTERKEAEDRLYAATQASAEAKARAEAANRAKDDFISMVSHELRTPLNTMRLWMRIMARQNLPEKDRAEGMQTLVRAVDAQQQVINDLLDVSRIATGKLRLELRATRLADTVDAAVDAVRPVAARKQILLSYQASCDIGIVWADPDRIQQVVWNLLSNAVKFTPSGGRVEVTVAREDEGVVLTVTDTGIGIRDDLLPHIFDRFLQGDSGSAREHTGLGLGLAIAKQLVELHSGTISASSPGNGQGSRFVVRLPLKSELLAADPARPAYPISNNLLLGVRILLVEDESGAREAARRLFEGASGRVQAVESAAAAREAYMLERPDVIISDIGMAGEDGYVFMEKIRALELEHGISPVPALALTAFARKEDEQKAINAGYDSHIAKPVDPDRLLQEISRLARPRAH